MTSLSILAGRTVVLYMYLCSSQSVNERLVLIAFESSDISGEPAPMRSLTRAITASTRKGGL